MNPSKKISEFLAQFLEFDAKQLHFGIWSGDLTISNVKLKDDALSTLFNSSLVTPEGNKETLNLKLVRGKVGHIRLKIPWKSLVWGQQPVRLFISDVDIVFALESPDETRHRSSKKKSHIQYDSISNEVSVLKKEGISIDDELLEQKYLWLEEAEARLLRGLPLQEPIRPISSSDNNDHVQRKNENKGFFSSLVNQMTTNMGMNAVAGLQAEIRNVRIAIQQSDIEIGCMLRCLEISSPIEKEGSTTTETSNLYSSDLNNSTTELASNNRIEKTKQIQQESEPDVWEINKELLIIEFAVFLRKIPLLEYPELNSFVKTSDLILKPTKIVIPITYTSPRPFPKENVKKMYSDHQFVINSQEKSSSSRMDTNNLGRKSRRGKREKITDILADDEHVRCEEPFYFFQDHDKRYNSVGCK
jgi:hypothetical protein